MPIKSFNRVIELAHSSDLIRVTKENHSGKQLRPEPLLEFNGKKLVRYDSPLEIEEFEWAGKTYRYTVIPVVQIENGTKRDFTLHIPVSMGCSMVFYVNPCATLRAILTTYEESEKIEEALKEMYKALKQIKHIDENDEELKGIISPIVAELERTINVFTPNYHHQRGIYEMEEVSKIMEQINRIKGLLGDYISYENHVHIS